MRRSPWHYPTLLRPAEQFFDVPLTTERMHNPASTPQVLIRAQHPPPQSGLLQLAAQRRIHTPTQGRSLVISTALGYHEVRQMFTGKCLLYPSLQAAARDTFRL